MHCVISWDISATGAEWGRLNEEMKAKLSTYSWARPLSTLYVVKVDSQSTWESILHGLIGVAKGHPGKINFIMSPMMQGGQYNGYLPGNMWNEINMRSR